MNHPMYAFGAAIGNLRPSGRPSTPPASSPAFRPPTPVVPTPNLTMAIQCATALVSNTVSRSVTLGSVSVGLSSPLVTTGNISLSVLGGPVAKAGSDAAIQAVSGILQQLLTGPFPASGPATHGDAGSPQMAIGLVQLMLNASASSIGQQVMSAVTAAGGSALDRNVAGAAVQAAIAQYSGACRNPPFVASSIPVGNTELGTKGASPVTHFNFGASAIEAGTRNLVAAADQALVFHATQSGRAAKLHKIARDAQAGNPRAKLALGHLRRVAMQAMHAAGTRPAFSGSYDYRMNPAFRGLQDYRQNPMSYRGR